MSAAARSGAAFDAIAAEYDSVFTNSRVGRAQRQVVWEMIDRVFRPGQHILEINCGTGWDALHMAERGIRVHACDASPAMVAIARKRAFPAGACVHVERLATEELDTLRSAYDGLLSNFGGLNCVDDLGDAVRKIRRLIRSGGSAIVCYMGPCCAWEPAWYLAHGEPRKAFRRWRRGGASASVSGGEKFQVRYPTVRAVTRAFAPAFRLVEWKGVGIFVPPSYAERFAAGHPRGLALAGSLDRWVGEWPLFRGLADHVLLRFEKVRA